jgi:hypothetical protein
LSVHDSSARCEVEDGYECRLGVTEKAFIPRILVQSWACNER